MWGEHLVKISEELKRCLESTGDTGKYYVYECGVFRGTSAKILADLPVDVAGKTGTPQTSSNTKTNAIFVAYAPADDPKIAVLVLIEDAREGSLNALPIARDVFGWYYENRLK